MHICVLFQIQETLICCHHITLAAMWFDKSYGTVNQI